MAFTSPFFQGTQAQGIIDNYVNAGGYNQSFPSPSTNPYLVNSSAYVPPSSQPQPDPDIPNCEEAYPGEGRIYDPVMNACVLPEVSTQPEGNDPEETKTFSERAYDSMARDVTDPYGSSNEIQKYFDEDMSNNSVNGDKYYNFDSSFDPGFPNPLINLGLQFGDKLFGGPERREDRFRTAIKTMLDQTPEGFEQGENSMGKLNMFGGQTYLDRVGNLNVNGNRNTNNLLNSMHEHDDEQGIPIAKDMSGSTITGYSLRNDDGTRNDTNYQATVAKNIARNMEKNKDSNRDIASKFSEKLGGFYGGR